uniref:Uncharacterized protein n=1 Tax=Noctiluca scintillans TaxID=2966 RepID=A0A6T8ST44_NOCSC|mmetsp:Transcript_1536/g.4229  ORF Transcript_1536/g.4229 Transcript_1536/m.4229 type:complete len:102 (+) Transcript_1536:64-369(+)
MGNSSLCSCQHVFVGKEIQVSTMGGRPVDPCKARPMPVGSMQDVASDRVNVWHSGALHDSAGSSVAHVLEVVSDAWFSRVTPYTTPVADNRCLSTGSREMD